jgi:hypothetical protein
MKFLSFPSMPLPPKPPLRPPAPPLLRNNGAHTVRLNNRVSRSAQATPVAASIVGSWQEPGSSDKVEFRDDGTLLEHTANGDGVRGRYALNDRQLVIRIDGVDELTFTVALQSDALELTDRDGLVTRYSRL